MKGRMIKEMMRMNTTEIKLEAKLVGDIQGFFFVPSYQRGYRWGDAEVIRLLDDIYATEGKRNYCLQPVVVRKNGDRFELIDGQQRLTTLYLIYRYMNEASFGFIDEPRFSLSYGTREKTEEFLKSLDISRKEENIDFWFIASAYESIRNWFEKRDRKSTLTNVNKYFDEIVKVIWYEVGENEDAISLFTRLNIGKIPLTSAELVKAMFLSKGLGTDMDKEKQEEISLQWDNMEKELHNDSLWYFLTNKTNVRYQTRIDLVLDLISGKPNDNREKYYTFFRFDEMRQSKSLDDIWRKIQKTFLLLKDWFENHELYHKIGYLIASGTMTLGKIFTLSQGKTKDEFRNSLDDYIRQSISIQVNYSELTYEKHLDQKKISTLLLLFNVESVRRNGENTQWFPFDKFKFGKGGKVTWSLEHTDSITVEQFARRIRIINNLIQNSEDEVSDRTDRNRIPAILSEVDAIVFTGEIDETIENNFNVNQLVEEKEKITFLKRNPDKAEAVFRLEDHPMLRGQISIVGLDHIDYVDRFYSLFSCTWDKIDCALMSIENYGQQERNKWRYQFASKGMLYAWNELFHKSANSGFENTKKTLVQLLASAETFTDDTLQTLTDKYITACEAAGLYPWRYYYVKYPVFRPGVYGKLSNSHADEKPYLFSVMQTKTQWSSNTYMPYLKAADGAHLSKDFMGQRLIYGDRHIICANNAYLLRNNDDESVIDIVRISQSEVGIDLEDRIKKLKAYITTL